MNCSCFMSKNFSSMFYLKTTNVYSIHVNKQNADFDRKAHSKFQVSMKMTDQYLFIIIFQFFWRF